MQGAETTMSSQWRPLETGGHSSLSPLGGQLGGRPMSRQITKNPQNLLQNFHPSQQQQSNGYGFNNFPLSPSGNSGNGSSSGGSSGMMHGSASTSRLSSLMSGGGSNFSSFGNDLESSGSGSNFSGNSGGAHYSGSRSMYNESRSSNNGFSGMIGGGGGGGSGFERSLSSGYDSHHHTGPERGGFDRQMSVPNNLPQPKFPVQNGFNGRSDGFNNRSSDGFNNRPDGFNNRSDGFNNRPSGFGSEQPRPSGFGSEQPRPMMSSNNDSFFGGNNMFGRSGSPNQMNGGSRPGFNDMKIGTWNEGGARYVLT